MELIFLLVKLDLHVHTDKSFDSPSSLSTMLEAACSKGLSGIAVTDHNVAYLAENEETDLIIIPACEYTTTEGHMLVYFLTEKLTADLKKDKRGRFPFEEICKRAHAQNALVFMAHPYSPPIERSEEIFAAVDGIEIYNARIEHSSVKTPNLRAQEKCRKLGKSFSAGSDAHFPEEVGYAYWECEIDGGSRDEQLAQIKVALATGKGKVYGGVANPMCRIKSQSLRMKLSGERLRLLKQLPRFLKTLTRLGSVREPQRIDFN